MSGVEAGHVGQQRHHQDRTAAAQQAGAQAVLDEVTAAVRPLGLVVEAGEFDQVKDSRQLARDPDPRPALAAALITGAASHPAAALGAGLIFAVAASEEAIPP